MVESEVIDKIKEIVDKLDEIEEYFDSLPELQSNIDSLISDYRHLIRENILNDKASVTIVKKMKEAELLRKKINRHHDLSNIYVKLKGRLISKENRQFLLTELHKKEKEWQYPYKYRVLTDEEIEELLNEKKKRGRPKKADDDNGDIQEN